MRCIRRLAVVVLLVAVPALAAQEAEPESHRPVGTGLEQETDPNAALAARLGKAREKLADETLGKSVEDLAKKLLKDEKFLDSLRKDMTPEKLEQLKRQFEGGKLPDTPELRKLLEKAEIGKRLGEKEKADISQWLQRNPDPTKPFPGPGPMPPIGPMPPSAMPPSAMPPPPSGVTGWAKETLERLTRTAEGWGKGSSGQGFRDFLTRLMANQQGGAAFADGLGKRLSGMGQYLPRLSGLVPRNLSGSLPNIRIPSLRQSFSTPGAALQTGKTALLFVVLALLAFLLWRGASMYQAYRQRLAAEWRLGPWPVLPHAVRTREQLVRAFEHLAFLVFGRPARSMSHEDLARGLAGRPALDPAAQAEAAEKLAASYRQARYAPAQDELSDEQLAQARQQLALLAGSAA
ncbi:MAG: hypothetical protein K2W96_12715 [Gemmataceae bacterium]|nr:hypothetical protein [Gemmataceae bacterium]